jgi:hypothetical protein
MLRRRFAILATLIASLVAGCSNDGARSGSIRPSEPAQVPSGPNARTITYSCVEGSSSTITVDLPSVDQLADLINGINVCEFDGGLVEISVEAPCPQGVRTVSVTAEGNRLTNQAVIDACALGP